MLLQSVLGNAQFLIKKRLTGQNRYDTFLAEYVKYAYDRGLVTAKRPGGDTLSIFLISSDYVKEFLMNDDYFENKFIIARLPVKFRMVFEHGPDAMRIRSLLLSGM